MASSVPVHPVTGDASWARVVRQARCADSGLDPDEWFPASIEPARARHEAAAAIAVCTICLVRAQCLELSLRHWDIGQHGVWGGLVAADRARLRGHGLIQDQQLGPFGDAEGEGELGALPTRQLPRPAGGVQAEPLDPVARLASVPAGVEPGAQLQMVGDAQPGVGESILGDEADLGRPRGDRGRGPLDLQPPARGRRSGSGSETSARKTQPRSWPPWLRPAGPTGA
jgi:Transcription factor WhiB